jgi:NADH:ubiquinone oxidoreductase subunit 4 (subunit M)
MRFWPNTVPETIAIYAPIFEIVCVITMLFIALICLSHKDFRYKLFAYTTAYCLLFLIGVFLPTGGLKMNIGYSIFTYIIIMTVLSFLISHIESQKKEMNLYNNDGVLCYMPRTSVCLSLFVLAGIGLPITPLFWNNFIIISEIFNYNLILGILVMVSLCVVAISFLEELYKMKGKAGAENNCAMSTDLSKVDFIIYISSLVALFFSFIKPLWFVF